MNLFAVLSCNKIRNQTVISIYSYASNIETWHIVDTAVIFILVYQLFHSNGSYYTLQCVNKVALSRLTLRKIIIR